MIQWYSSTLLDYVVVGAVILLSMFGLHWLLTRLGAKREVAAGYALILPWLLGFLIWNLGPYVASFYLSLTDYNVLQAPKFAGLANYRYMFSEDPNFWASLRFTLLYSVINVPLGLGGALVTATLLNQKIRGQGFWRTLYYLPAVLPAAATALLWRWMFAQSGLINSLLKPALQLLNQPLPAWFADEHLVLPAYVIMGLWGVFGANTIILLAGLKNIPRDMYEAAEIDGAGRLACYFSITIPMLSASLFYILIMGIISSLQTFTAAFFIETPRSAGVFMNVYLYQQAFTQFKMGYAAAIGWIMMVIIMLFTLLVFKSSPGWVYYESDKEA
jgi:multiple sugar transport system permease protein